MSAVAEAQVSPVRQLLAEPVAGRASTNRSPLPSESPVPSESRTPTESRGSTEPTNATMHALSQRALALELLETGVEATALLAAVRLTGMTCNGVPVVALTLVVDLPGEPPRVVVRHAVVPLDDHPVDGTRPRVAVLVDPERRDNVLLRFDLRPLA